MSTCLFISEFYLFRLKTLCRKFPFFRGTHCTNEPVADRNVPLFMCILRLLQKKPQRNLCPATYIWLSWHIDRVLLANALLLPAAAFPYFFSFNVTPWILCKRSQHFINPVILQSKKIKVSKQKKQKNSATGCVTVRSIFNWILMNCMCGMMFCNTEFIALFRLFVWWGRRQIRYTAFTRTFAVGSAGTYAGILSVTNSTTFHAFMIRTPSD